MPSDVPFPRKYREAKCSVLGSEGAESNIFPVSMKYLCQEGVSWKGKFQIHFNECNCEKINVFGGSFLSFLFLASRTS